MRRSRGKLAAGEVSAPITLFDTMQPAMLLESSILITGSSDGNRAGMKTY